METSKLIMELDKGKEYANQLQELLLLKPFGDEGLILQKGLVEKILTSFTESLDVLNSHGRMYQIGADNESSFQDSGDGKRAGVKHKRGCYKRKRASKSWVIVKDTMEDGHAWRKYGQKQILNTTYPRCYFRCTHKYGQGCKARKQVQRSNDETSSSSIMYQITYLGHHTCKDDSTNPPDSMEFNSSKQACKQETQSDLMTVNKSSSNSTLWQDLIGSSVCFDPELDLSPARGSYNGEMAYTTAPTSFHGLDMDTCFADDFTYFFDENGFL